MAEAKEAAKNKTEAAVVVPTVEPTKLKGKDALGTVRPAAVTRVYSSRGLEYLFMVISLVALTLGAALLGADIIEYLFDTSTVSGPLSEWAGLEALTVVGAIFFFYLWSRLRAVEEISPAVITDPSRKRALQRGLIFGFISLIIASFSFVYILFEILSDGQDIVSTDWQSILVSVYVLGVVGAAFNFLFNQERKGD